MKIQLLPYGFRRIGIILFVLFAIPSGIQGFEAGFVAAGTNPGSELMIPKFYSTLGIMDLLIYSDLISIAGLFVFIISKDKVFDEFLLKLRYESIQITFLVSLFVIMLVILLKKNWSIDASYVLEMQMIGFLIIYKVRKSFYSEA